MKIIDRFEVAYYQYLSETGHLIDDASVLAKNTEALINLYRLMVLLRTFDTKAIALQRTGKLGTYPSTKGQEAVFVGIGAALDKNDVFVPYYRDSGTLMQRGVPLSQILLYWGGDERGNCFLDSRDFPFSVPVGSQPLHAVGVAYALKYKKENAAVLTTCGDGATSEGDFYEAMNVAGAWKLPVVFVVCNNQLAISVPRKAQSAAHTLAQKAIAAGFSGEQIDGNDIIAVVERTKTALKNARENHEPRLLEMICYRQGDHTTADDASRYEPKELREIEWKKEPNIRLKKYLEELKVWTVEHENALQKACNADVEKEVEDYLKTKPQKLESMFDYLYENLPKAYQNQRDLVKEMEYTEHA